MKTKGNAVAMLFGEAKPARGSQPPGKGEMDDEEEMGDGEEGGDDEEALDAAQAFLDAVKSGDAAQVLEAFVGLKESC